MRKSIIVILLAALAGGGINQALADSEGHHSNDREYGERHHAMSGKDCKKHGKFRMEKMQKMLGLSDEQVSRIRQIREKYRPQMQELREQSRANRKKLREARQAESIDMAQIEALAQIQGNLKAQKIILKAKKHNEIRTVFTKEQIVRLREMKQKYHNDRDDDREHHGKHD